MKLSLFVYLFGLTKNLILTKIFEMFIKCLYLYFLYVNMNTISLKPRTFTNYFIVKTFKKKFNFNIYTLDFKI